MGRRFGWQALVVALGACDAASSGDRDDVRVVPPAPLASASPSAEPVPAPPESAPATRRLTLLAGGDVSFGRVSGQMLLRDPEIDFFAHVKPWLESADIRFANLEGPISDQKGETQRPDIPLVFTGPPAGADALARARFTIVSTANNHAWDYGKSAMLETIAHLDRVGVAHVGTGPDRASSRAPTIVRANGLRLGFLAVTGIWNQGPLEKHEGDEYVARADETELAEAVRALRASGEVDAIAVSHHGGDEYVPEPRQRTVRILHAAIDAGADFVIGHHPHVIQGVEWYRGKPIFYSLGNWLMRMALHQPWTEFGFLARIALEKTGDEATVVTRVEACPFRIFGVEVLPFVGDKNRALLEQRFFNHLKGVSGYTGGLDIQPASEDGCAELGGPSRP